MKDSVFFFIFFLAFIVSCRQALRKQPKLDVYDASTFYKDQNANRLPIADTYIHRFISDEKKSGPPKKIDRQFLVRGQQRYEIYCMVCHGMTGEGQGIVTQRGFSPPPSFHNDRLRNVKPDYFYDVITNGKGRMPRFGDRISEADRWAIAYYIRVLQQSQYLEYHNLNPNEKNQLEKK